MIARLTVVAPFALVAPDGASYSSFMYEDSGYTISARAPLVIGDAPLPQDLPTQLEIDAKPAFIANGLQFDIRKNSFDRSLNAPSDPPLPFLQRIVDSFLARLRFVTRSPQIQTVSLEGGTSWRLDYRNDDDSELQADPALRRMIMGRVLKWSSVALTPTIWDQMHELEPNWSSPVWDDILLDAFHALPKVGTAVVLGATALEVFVADILDRLSACGDVPPSIWAWINKRDNWLKDPSTEEQFDVLLKHYCGHSLKESAQLWQAFKELRTARNSFVHGGRAVVGGTSVTPARAAELVNAAGEITRLVRSWLPESQRWPMFSTTETLNVVFPILGKASSAAT